MESRSKALRSKMVSVNVMRFIFFFDELVPKEEKREGAWVDNEQSPFRLRDSRQEKEKFNKFFKIGTCLIITLNAIIFSCCLFIAVTGCKFIYEKVWIKEKTEQVRIKGEQ